MVKKKITIALCGSTNAGKTTLARTLLHEPVGTVRDEAGVTTGILRYDVYAISRYHGFLAEIVDVPGFQEAGLLLHPSTASIPDLEEDRRALAAIQASDLAIYVASLESVPSRAHRSELKLIQQKQVPFVGILNKEWSVGRGSREEKVQKRIDLWTAALLEQGARAVVRLDAHWSSPQAIADLYLKLANCLDGDSRERFLEAVNSFTKWQSELRRKSIDGATVCLGDIRHIGTVRQEVAKGVVKEQILGLQREVRDAVSRRLQGFLEWLCDLHEKENERLRELHGLDGGAATVTEESRLNAAATGSGLGGSGGAAIGSGLGLLIGGPAGAWLGAQIGATVGGICGAVIGLATNGDVIIYVSLQEHELRTAAHFCVAAIWTAMFLGHGGAEILTDEVMQQIANQVNRMRSGPFQWSEANELGIEARLRELLDDAEKAVFPPYVEPNA